jgi:hypothetical protein
VVYHFKNADVHRAGDCAMPAAYTQVNTKSFLVVYELVHGPLPPAAVLRRAGIMTAGFQCEVNVVAGVIALVTHACLPDLLIGDLEAMTGRANESAGVAAYAVARSLFKSRRVKAFCHLFIDVFIIHLQAE